MRALLKFRDALGVPLEAISPTSAAMVEAGPASGREPASGNMLLARVHRDVDLIEIPQLAVAGAMGDGSFPPDHIDVVQHVTARISELRKLCSFTDPKNLQVITGYGRSMMPTFCDGDPLLIDTGVNTVDIDAVYAFTFDRKFYIKGMQRMPRNGLRVISHNKAENDPWDIKDEEMDLLVVHGRIVLAWNARRL
jgi:phage repressor protein C with HTH and peptisase S24 domain